MNASLRQMTIGDRVPNFMLEDQAGAMHELYNTDLTGGPIIVLIPGTGETDTLQQFKVRTETFDALGAHCYALIAPGEDRADAASKGSNFILLNDADGDVRKGYLEAAGFSAPALFALDPNQRIIAIADANDATAFADIARSAFEKITPRESPKLVSELAPVLIIPNVLNDTDCDRLVKTWEEGDKRKNEINVASGETSSKASRSEVKRRSDVIIDGAMERHLLITLMPRYAPEIERAFSFDKEWGFEKFRVGCYEAEDAGFFRAHRDNPSEALSHRQFAASLNLNDGYEGGYLRFPEYGPNHYAPPKGGVLIFSCGLLHEVVPVVSGRRFTLLTFISTRL